VGGPTGSFMLWDMGLWSMHFAPIIVPLGSQDSAILLLATRNIQVLTHWRPDRLCLQLTCCHQTKEKKRPITQARVDPLPPFQCPLEACYDSVIKTSTPMEEGVGSITTSVNASVRRKSSAPPCLFNCSPFCKAHMRDRGQLPGLPLSSTFLSEVLSKP
jgi:hypothetical protein